MKKLLPIIVTIIALIAFVIPASASTSASSTFPYFTILEVVKDQTVTIQAYNFPANDSFRVTMGPYGSYGINGVVVGFSDTGSGGSFTATYTIPSTLVGSAKIAIRLQSPTSGYYAYNWFWNNPPTAPTTTPVPGYSGIPTFSIKSVVKNDSVTILTNNFPPNDSFTVTMGKYGTKGIGGVVVTTTNSGEGGAFEVTYKIPSSLYDMNPIAIRLESPTTGYFAYNWFYNTTANTTPTEPQPTPTPAPTEPQPTPTPAPPAYSGFPTFTVTAVVRDSTVTISGSNFPGNDTFTVYMGAYGTKGVGGVSVGSTSTGSGGAITATYNIPSSLAGSTRIAIRLQSPTSGYFAYNWFWNNTYP
jgi:hypothetical protein